MTNIRYGLDLCVNKWLSYISLSSGSGKYGYDDRGPLGGGWVNTWLCYILSGLGNIDMIIGGPWVGVGGH